MAGSILTPQTINREALKILEQEMERNCPVFSLTEVTLKDGTVLGPIMLELKPYEIDRIQEVVSNGYQVLTLANENESILFPAADIKHIKMMRVTSKE